MKITIMNEIGESLNTDLMEKVIPGLASYILHIRLA